MHQRRVEQSSKFYISGKVSDRQVNCIISSLILIALYLVLILVWMKWVNEFMVAGKDGFHCWVNFYKIYLFFWNLLVIFIIEIVTNRMAGLCNLLVVVKVKFTSLNILFSITSSLPLPMKQVWWSWMMGMNKGNQPPELNHILNFPSIYFSLFFLPLS
jgi:hypothetical protein